MYRKVGQASEVVMTQIEQQRIRPTEGTRRTRHLVKEQLHAIEDRATITTEVATREIEATVGKLEKIASPVY